MTRVLITGAGSYIGVSVEKWLGRFSDRYQVDVLDMISPEWRDYSFEGYDVVYHVAGIAHRKNVSDELYDTVNNLLAVEVAQKAVDAGVSQYIFMSSGAVYSQSDKTHDYIEVSESTQCNPCTAYGASKLRAEQGIQKVIETKCSKMKLAILRPPTVYGFGAKGNYGSLAKLAVKTPFVPKVENRRSMIYIDNLCEFVRLVIDSGAEGIFIPQNREYVCSTELMCQIAKLYGRKIYKLPGLTWAVRIMGHIVDPVNKVFGTYIYCPEKGEYFEGRYQVVDHLESVRKSEGL